MNEGYAPMAQFQQVVGDFDDDGDADGADLADFLARDSWTSQLLETLAGEFGRDDCPLPETPQ